MKKLSALIIAAGPLFGPAHAAVTQDEIDALKLEKEAAVIRKEKAEAEQAEQQAKIGKLTVETPKGTGEATGLNVEAKIVAYNEAVDVATWLAKEIKPLLKPKVFTGADGRERRVPAHVVIFNEADLRTIYQARILRSVVSSIATDVATYNALDTLDSFEKDCKKAATGGMAPLAALDLGLQVLSVFRVDKKLTGTDVTVDDAALANAVAGRLLAEGITAIRPQLLVAEALNGTGLDAVAQSPTIKDLNRLNAAAATTKATLDDLPRQRSAIEELAKQKGVTAHCKDVHKRDLTALNARERSAQALLARVDKVTTTVSAATAEGTTLLERLALADALATRFNDAYVLDVKAVAAGGTLHSAKNWFTTSFSLTGGVVVTYHLVDGTTGSPLAAGTVTSYGGQVKLADLTGSVK